jgi:hypothetical protein
MSRKIYVVAAAVIAGTSIAPASEMSPQELVNAASMCPDAPRMGDYVKRQERFDCLSALTTCVQKGVTHSSAQLKACVDKAWKPAPQPQ